MFVVFLTHRNAIRLNDAVTVTLHRHSDDLITLQVFDERSDATQTIEIARGGMCRLPFEATLTFIVNGQDRARVGIEYSRDRVKVERIERSGEDWVAVSR